MIVHWIASDIDCEALTATRRKLGPPVGVVSKNRTDWAPLGQRMSDSTGGRGDGHGALRRATSDAVGVCWDWASIVECFWPARWPCEVDRLYSVKICKQWGWTSWSYLVSMVRRRSANRWHRTDLCQGLQTGSLLPMIYLSQKSNEF